MPVCPVCNSLAVAEKICPLCGNPMLDAGLLQDFYDNYSAYLDRDVYEDGYMFNDEDYCIHFFYCPQCQINVNLAVKKVDEDSLME